MKDAKGHGSNARGAGGKSTLLGARLMAAFAPSHQTRAPAAHGIGVNGIGHPVVSPKALDVIRKNPSGFSVTIHGETPTSGHMVALPGRSRIINGKPALHDVDEYARANADVLRQPGAHIGGWHNESEGKTYLDVSHNIADRNAAIAAGRARNQIAIWDVKHGKEIPTGGDGR